MQVSDEEGILYILPAVPEEIAQRLQRIAQRGTDTLPPTLAEPLGESRIAACDHLPYVSAESRLAIRLLIRDGDRTSVSSFLSLLKIPG